MSDTPVNQTSSMVALTIPASPRSDGRRVYCGRLFSGGLSDNHKVLSSLGRGLAEPANVWLGIRPVQPLFDSINPLLLARANQLRVACYYMTEPRKVADLLLL